MRQKCAGHEESIRVDLSVIEIMKQPSDAQIGEIMLVAKDEEIKNNEKC